MEIIVFLALGLGVGIFGTLVGIGGGLILVPIFILFMSEGGIYPYFHSASQIVGTSLFVVLTNALSGTIAYLRQKRIYFRAAIPFALATLPGAFLGSYAADYFNQGMLDFYFGLFLLCIGCLMFYNTQKRPPANQVALPNDFQFNMPLGVGSSLGVGFISSLFGIGGGTVHVPLMIYLLDFPVHIATATSHFVLACSSAFGVVSHFILDHIIWLPAICISLGAAIGAQIGAKISKKTKSKIILALLSLAMFALGCRLILMGSIQ